MGPALLELLPFDVVAHALLFLPACDIRDAALVSKAVAHIIRRHKGVQRVLAMEGPFVVGGYDGREDRNILWHYNGDLSVRAPLSGASGARRVGAAWQQMPGAMQHGRCHSAAQLYDRKLYVVGGRDDELRLKSCEVFDPMSETWAALPSLSVPRAGGALAAVRNTLLAFGGFDGERVLSSAESLSLAAPPRSTDVWAAPTEGHVWAALPSMPRHVTGMATATMNDNVFLISGAENVDNIENMEYSDSTLLFNTAKQCYSALPGPKKCRFEAKAVAYGSCIVLAGGVTSHTDILDSVEVLDTRTGRWEWESQTATMRQLRCNFGMFVAREKLYALGGFMRSQGQLASCESTTPEYVVPGWKLTLNKFTSCTSLPERLEGISVAYFC